MIKKFNRVVVLVLLASSVTMGLMHGHAATSVDEAKLDYDASTMWEDTPKEERPSGPLRKATEAFVGMMFSVVNAVSVWAYHNKWFNPAYLGLLVQGVLVLMFAAVALALGGTGMVVYREYREGRARA